MGFFDVQGRLASRRPWVAIGIVALLTVGFSAGFFIDQGPPQDQAEQFLPPGSELAQAQARIQEDFGEQSTQVPVQVLVRGDAGRVLTPAGLQEILDALTSVQTEPDVAPLLVAGGTVSVAHILLGPLQAVSYDAVSQAQIDEAVALVGPAIQGLVACTDPPCDPANTFATLAIVSLDGSGTSEGARQALIDAQLAMEDALDGRDWQVVEARTFSSAKLTQESQESQGASTNILMLGAIGVILVLLVVFYRTGSDVALTIGGLVLAVIWVFGLQGLLGPGGVGVIGADSPMAMMIPILLIGLTVDYALQITGRYREQIQAGTDAREAMRSAVRDTGLPLLLAAGTTALSFATNVTSSLPPMQDFGIIAAAGVLMGWFVMATFVPSVRTLLDARRVRRGKRVQDRHMADAIPGVNRVITGASDAITRHPAIFAIVAVAVSAAAFVGAANVSTTFSQTDFLPENTESYEDLVFLQDNFNGGDATATLLIEGDLTDADVLRALVDMELRLADETVRPPGMTGPVRASLMTLAFDWAIDDGLPGDKHDPAVAELLQELDRFFPPADAVEALYAYLQEIDPAGTGQVLAIHADRPDRTIITIPVVSGDPALTRALVRELQGEWDGDPDAFWVTGSEVLAVGVTDELTESQTESVTITILAALVLLMIFFGITEKRPILGVLTVLPIGLVVGWVLGTMFLLGISYNVMTALITALTIGVGVDYTIHITHRFLEEQARGLGIGRAVHESLRTTGGALIGSALTTAGGFGMLLFSPLTPMQQFGGLTALTIVFSLVAAFFVLPPLLVLWALWSQWRGQGLPGDHALSAAPSGGTAAGSADAGTFVIGASAAGRGRTVRCPRCDARTFVPQPVKALRCPSPACDFGGPVPDTV